MNIKQLGLYSVFFITLISLVGNYWQMKVVEQKDVRIGHIMADLDNSLVANQNLTEQVGQLQKERIAAQKAADELAALRVVRQKGVTQTITVIKEVLVHEECADKPIPFPDGGLHYY